MNINEMISAKLDNTTVRPEETRSRFIVFMDDDTREKLDKLHGATGVGRINLATEILKMGIDQAYEAAEEKLGKLTKRPLVEKRR